MKREKTLRHPIVSGLFYPDGTEELKSTVDGYLEQVELQIMLQRIREQTGLDDVSAVKPVAVIAPHAGYIFSGSVQACSYALLRRFSYDTVIIVGPSHQSSFCGISVNLDSAYSTPIGNVKVDLEFAELLTEFSQIFRLHEDAHLSEHALEVQLPFLLMTVPGAKIVPVLLGEQNMENALILRDGLLSVMGRLSRACVLVISTDLSHYHSHVDASLLDQRLIEELKSMNPDSLYSCIQEGSCEACGFGGILTGMMFAAKAGRGKVAVLGYKDSGEVSGERRKVVGYLSAVLY